MRAMLVGVATTLLLVSGCAGTTQDEPLADHRAQYRQEGLAVGTLFVRDQAHDDGQVMRRSCFSRASRLQKVTPTDRLAHVRGCLKAVRDGLDAPRGDGGGHRDPAAPDKTD